MDKLRKTDVSSLFLLVILGLVLYVALDVVAQLLPPYYSPVSQAESDLAVGKFGFVMTINFLNRGLFSLLFILAFLRTLNLAKVARSHFRTGVYLLGVWAVGALLLAGFPTDVPATPISWHGAIHLVVATIAFFGGALGALIISLRLGKNEAFQKLRTSALLIAIVSVILLFVALATLTGPLGGLTERLFLGSVLLWIGVTSAYLATHIKGKNNLLNAK